MKNKGPKAGIGKTTMDEPIHLFIRKGQHRNAQASHTSSWQLTL